MTRLHSFLKAAPVFAISAALSLSAPRAAEAQVVVGVDVRAPEVVIEPPAAYIATAAPEYFEGRPVYYYNNYWYYRDRGRWSFYRSEPIYLRERRAHWVGGYYGRPGYVRGGYVRGGYVRGGYVRPAPARWVYRR
jgi:hypothetical protein